MHASSIARSRSLPGFLASALLICAALAGCGAPARGLPPGTLEAAGPALPSWSGGLTQESLAASCPRGEACVVGLAHGFADAPTALKAARVNAYVQLAERVFPVQVAARFHSVETLEGSSASEAITTELVGRMRDTRVLEEFWLKRRSHDLKGAHQVFDGWVLVAAEPQALAALYQDEVRRSLETARELGARLQAALDELRGTPAPGDAVVRGLALLKDARQALEALQEVVGRAEARAGLEALERRVGALLEVRAGTPDVALAAHRLRVPLTLSAGRAPLAGVVLQVGRPGGVDLTSLVTDRSGVVQVELTVPAWLAPGELEVVPVDAPALARRLPLPVPWTCVRAGQEWRVGGPLGAQVLALVQARGPEGATALAASTRACSGAPSPAREAALTLVVSVNTSQVRRQGKVAEICGAEGTASAALRWGGEEARVFLALKPVGGAGVDASSVARRLAEAVGAVLLEALATVRL
jgi:hypothetical protein